MQKSQKQSVSAAVNVLIIVSIVFMPVASGYLPFNYNGRMLQECGLARHPHVALHLLIFWMHSEV